MRVFPLNCESLENNHDVEPVANDGSPFRYLALIATNLRYYSMMLWTRRPVLDTSDSIMPWRMTCLLAWPIEATRRTKLLPTSWPVKSIAFAEVSLPSVTTDKSSCVSTPKAWPALRQIPKGGTKFTSRNRDLGHAKSNFQR